MKRTPLLVAVFVLVTLSRAFAGNTIVCPSARTGNDTVDWSQLGPPGTILLRGFTATASPVPITVTDGPSSDQVLQEGTGFYGAFLGDFAIGDNLLSSGSDFSRLRMLFSTGVSQVGAQVDPPYGNPRQVTIAAYDQSYNLLGDCAVQANNQGKQNNTAPYIGIAEVDGNNNPVAGIYFVEIRTYDLPVAINKLSMTTAGCGIPPNTGGASYKYGDVFDSVGFDLSGSVCRGCVKEVKPMNGALVQNLPDGSGYSATTGMAFDVAGNLYVTNWRFGTVSKLDKTGAVVNAALMTPANDGQSAPESIRAVGTLPNLSDLKLYVGGPACACVLVYNSAGILQNTVNVAGAGTTGGTDWIDFLTPNILVYTGEGSEIKAYDIVANKQLPDIINNLPGYRDYEVRVGHPSLSCGISSCTLPDPYILVADKDYALLIDPTLWLNANPIGSVPGVLKTTYSLPGVVRDFALAIDPDNIHFWTGDVQGSDTVWQVNTCSAKIGYSWSLGLSAGGLTVWGGLGSVW
jgi:hypothetical protein